MNRLSIAAAACVGALAPHACSQISVRIPSEFSEPTETLTRLFTVGGVAGFEVTPSDELVYQGGSLQVDIGFNANGIFSFSNVGLGASNVSGGDFTPAPGADTFSVTIKAPAAPVGGLRLYVTLRDDDNLDGRVDAANDDDQWEAGPVTINPGTFAYNIPLATFVDANQGTGDDTPNFASGLAGTFILTIETAESMPGGLVTQPVTLHVDHAGVYVGDQTPPTGGPCNNADLADPFGTLDFSDVLAFLSAFGAGDPAADLAPPAGTLDFSDVLGFLTTFGSGCP